MPVFPENTLCADNLELAQIARLHFTQLFKRTVVLEDSSLLGPLYTATAGKNIKMYVVLAKKNANDGVIPKEQALDLLEQCIGGLFQKDKVTRVMRRQWTRMLWSLSTSMSWLWYFLVLGASIALICDIAFLVMGMEFRIYDNAALAIIADSITIFAFAYIIWGRGIEEPLLAFSATSASWKRFLRVFGSCFLILLWVLTRVPTVAGLGVGIVLAAEMVLGYKIGSLQRNLILQGQGWEEKPAEARDGEEEGTEVEPSATGASRNPLKSMDRGNVSVEIVRPPEVDAMYTRFLLESYLGQFQRQQQAHLQHTWQQERSEGREPGQGKEVIEGASEVKGEEEAIVRDGNGQLGDLDDPLKESSFKFEVPVDTPLEPAPGMSSSLAPDAPSSPTVHILLHPSSVSSLSSSAVVEDRQVMSVRPLPDRAPKDSTEDDK
ncbi:hypothetical protein BGZ70_006731 [Mortierella alpina]|uniref:Uncharacterized protein n=1 Tax=Mortierella alpina TaxID=64518 RepID=A0A9P6J7F4_MORAP|nr:hypothetical protein BGZ70_006731 [Mortierella alpina]